MAKKNWIYIKRGLSEDPKHRAQMGECIWLFLHIIDRADFETGIAYDWKDAQEAAEMSMSLPTLRHQRRKLEELGYITAKKGMHKQDLIIHNWTNPRDYSGKLNNKKQSDNPLSPESDNQSDNQSYNQSDNHPSSQVNTPTSNSESDSQSISSQDFKFIQNTMQQSNIGMNTQAAQLISEWMAEHEQAWIVKAIQDNPGKHQNYIDKILVNWKANGYPKQRKERIEDAKQTTSARRRISGL